MNSIGEIFYGCALDGFVRSPVTGVCQFAVMGEMDEEFYITISNKSLRFNSGIHNSPEAKITIPRTVFQKILNENHLFDMRNPQISTSTRIEGKNELLNSLFSLIKRPSQEVVELFANVEEFAKTGPAITRVEVLHEPTMDQVIEAHRCCKPVVVKGCLDDWKSLSWSFDFMKRRFGHLNLRSKNGSEGEFQTLGEFIDLFAGNGNEQAVYSAGCTLPLGMWSYFKFPFFHAEELEVMQLWMGNGFSDRPVTTLHRDALTGMLAQVCGKKRMVLYSPDQAGFLYPNKAYNWFQSCPVDPGGLYPDEYPLFRNASPVEIELVPGDLLINPAGWFHCAYSSGPVMSISRFIKSGTVTGRGMLCTPPSGERLQAGS